jgi:hypothetical protein
MKLTNIFALAAAMAAVCAAQNATPASTNGKPQTLASNAANKPSAATTSGSAPKVSGPATNVPAAAKSANSQASATKQSTPGSSNTKPPVPAVAVTPAPQGATKTKSTTSATAQSKKAKSKGPRVSRSGQAAANGATAQAPKSGGSQGRRDPFVSAIRSVSPSGPSGPPCATGKRCLSIPELTLRGTVKDATGKMMALVYTPANRMYILRENDQVFNGSVIKITADSVIFREFTTDKVGHESAHEVVKKLSPSS